MKVQRVSPAGYCQGVIKAINIAKETAKQYPQEKITILGMIVHNRYVTAALAKLGIKTLDDPRKSKEELLAQVKEGVIIFTAHGISESVKAQALAKGLIVVDASCQNVIETQNIIKAKLHEGYTILYIGVKNHPEAEAVLALSKQIHLLTSLKDLAGLKIESSKIFVTNQTTMSLLETATFKEAIAKQYPSALFAPALCYATTARQKAILALKDCDLLYIVGDPRSNNTEKLKSIALKKGIKKVLMIKDACMLAKEDLQDVENVYVTAGASTPPYLTDQVIDTLKEYAQTKVLKKPDIDIERLI